MFNFARIETLNEMLSLNFSPRKEARSIQPAYQSDPQERYGNSASRDTLSNPPVRDPPYLHQSSWVVLIPATRAPCETRNYADLLHWGGRKRKGP